jgi:hypothetical protein
MPGEDRTSGAARARGFRWGPVLRRVHVWIGAFIAPSVLFFAFSGGLQLFRLNEPHAGYEPPALIQKLGVLHKDQRFVAPRRRPEPPAATSRKATTAPKPVEAKAANPAETALKWLFLLVAAGLFVSTSLGVWMALAFSRNRILVVGLLAAGTLLPVIIVALL